MKNEKLGTVSNYSGRLYNGCIMAALKRRKLGPKARLAVASVLVHGCEQAVVARQLGVSRQRIHSLCRSIVAEIEAAKN